jgi:HK97 gp10 family phage protein
MSLPEVAMAELNPRVIAKLRQIPDVAVDAARQAMEEGAAEMVQAMRSAAPRGTTGRLVVSIGWTWGDLPPGTFMIDEIRSGGSRGEQYATLRLRIYAGSGKGFYARFHEFGTVKMAARPFFYPTWRARRAEYRRDIRTRVRAAIRKAWRNG